MHFVILAGAAAVVLVARILLPCVRGLFSPLRTIPEPIAARLTDLWYLWRVRRGAFEIDIVELHQKYA
jgi:hypothetical protein